MTRKTHVVVLYGGTSSEHSISCISAGGILGALDRDRFEVTTMGITRSGAWVRTSPDPQSLVAEDGKLPEVDPTGAAVMPPPGPGQPFRQQVGQETWQPLPVVDVVFPVLHGPFGEDGTVQGILESAALPYVGSGVFASAAAMDKGHTKALLESHGIGVGRWVAPTLAQWRADRDHWTAQVGTLGYPVFVKPCRAGSSVGVAKVHDPDELAAAVEAAGAHDPRLIIEASAEGAREIECGVLVRDDVPQASVCAEIRVRSGHEFYDFEAKYLDDSAELIVPAELDEATHRQLRQSATAVFAALGCEGLARVDFFLLETGDFIVNEVNTMPGFTPISMFPKMWDSTGLAYPGLVETLIHDAIARGTGLR